MAEKSKWLTRTPDLEAMVPYWDKTDAIVEGHDAVRRAGRDYLPEFAQEADDDYKTRLALTKFTNVYRDVLEGLATKPFENEITLKGDNVPPEVEKFCMNVDGSGNNLSVFGSLCFFNGINSALAWIFIDYPDASKTAAVRTRADQQELGIQPYWTLILARNVLQVKSEIINGKEVINYIRILEPGLGEPTQVRVFERSPAGVVTWFLMQETSEKNAGVDEGFKKIADGTLSIDVIPMVPFVTGRRDGKSWKFFPVMSDAADLQITLYQDESALQFIKTMAGYPMLSASGVKPQYEADGKTIKKVAVGPQRVLYAPPNGDGKSGEWKYVEPSAQSMEFLSTSIKDTKSDLRELGRQPLTAQSGNITAITSAVAAGKARSAVSAWALGLQDALENALVITMKWINNKYDPEVSVYTDFDNITEEGNDVDALNTMRENGDLSQDTLWEEMKRRKILSPDFDAEKEKNLILKGIPVDDQPTESKDPINKPKPSDPAKA